MNIFRTSGAVFAAMSSLLVFSAFATSEERVVLAERGEGIASVELPDNPTEVEKYAAAEFEFWARKLVGECGKSIGAKLVLRRSDEYGEEGFRLKTGNRSLIIEGGVRGLLYGVYEVLETYGGIGWFSSWHSVVPKDGAIAVPPGLDKVQKPAFELRDNYWHDAFNGDFAARIRHNGNMARLEARHGGKPYRFGGGLGACHTFMKLVPVEEYGEAHPEYFAYRKANGRRMVSAKSPQSYMQLCLTNPDVLEIVTSNLLAAIARDPGARYYGVSQNDNRQYCECPRCEAVDDEEGSHAGTNVRFINAVAERVAKVYPQKVIETLAYQYTRRPPAKTQLRDNVMPCLCSIECDFARPLSTGLCEDNVRFRDDIAGWAKQTKRLYLWDYQTAFHHYLVPFPNVGVLRDNLKFFHENGVKSVLEQGAYQGYHGEFAELKAWLNAKWMWNPYLREEPLLDRFFAGYYGAAAPFVREYFDKLQSLTTLIAPTNKMSIWIGPSSKVFPKGFALEGAQLMKKAMDAVKGDPAYEYNVRMTAVSPLYLLVFGECRPFDIRIGEEADLSRRRRVKSAKFILSALAEAESKGRHVRLAESRVYERTYMGKLRQAALCAGDVVGNEASVEEAAFNVAANGGNDVKTVDDPKAGDGKALKMCNTSFEWFSTLPFSSIAYEDGAKYTIRLRVRVEKTGEGDQGAEAIWFGIRDMRAKKSVVSRSRKLSEMSGEYEEVELISGHALSDDETIWIAAGRFDKKMRKFHQGHDGVYIDRIVFRPDHTLRPVVCYGNIPSRKELLQ